MRRAGVEPAFGAWKAPVLTTRLPPLGADHSKPYDKSTVTIASAFNSAQADAQAVQDTAEQKKG